MGEMMRRWPMLEKMLVWVLAQPWGEFFKRERRGSAH
jgi:hypothetical protein